MFPRQGRNSHVKTDSASVPRRAFQRYREHRLEYPALQAVARGLFLAVILMVAFLYVFTQVTGLIAGQNEVIIPTNRLDPSVDLGAIVRGAFTRTSGSVVSVIGVVTLIVSSFVTARALRQGTRLALLDAPAKVRWRDGRTLIVAVALSLLILATWLLTLATAIRRAAWSTLLGMNLNEALVDLAKVGTIVFQFMLFAGAAGLACRLVSGRWPHMRAWGYLAIFALVGVALNFFMLYSYVGALTNPNVSAGLVLVFTLLLWANIVVRAYLGSLCCVAEDSAGGVAA